jgi:hypothetical protein
MGIVSDFMAGSPSLEVNKFFDGNQSFFHRQRRKKAKHLSRLFVLLRVYPPAGQLRKAMDIDSGSEA